MKLNKKIIIICAIFIALGSLYAWKELKSEQETKSHCQNSDATDCR